LKNLPLRNLWHRVWIFQELAVASVGILLCGSRRVLISEFKAVLNITTPAIFAINFTFYYRRRSLSWFRHNNRLPRTPLGLQLRDEYQNGDRPSLPALIIHESQPGGPQLTATDPRDVIFSLLGIVRTYELPIVADYDMPVDESLRARRGL